MTIHESLRQALLPLAEGAVLDTLAIGLGYTCAMVRDHKGEPGVGVAYTPDPDQPGCSLLEPDEEYEGAPAAQALDLLCSGRGLHRAIGLAVANGLNHARAMALPEDRDTSALFDSLGIGPGTRVAMVGCFTPLLKRIKERGAELDMVDRGRGLGDEQAFRDRLRTWPQAVIITSTSLINNTLEELLDLVPGGARVALLGPSTPLVPEAFAGRPVHVLGGTVPMDGEATLRAVRHAKGTPVIQRFSRKPYIIV